MRFYLVGLSPGGAQTGDRLDFDSAKPEPIRQALAGGRGLQADIPGGQAVLRYIEPIASFKLTVTRKQRPPLNERFPSVEQALSRVEEIAAGLDSPATE